MVKYLCLFAQEFADFRIQELQTLCEFFQLDIDIDRKSYRDTRPYLLIDLQNENDAKLILSRSILLKSISALLVNGKHYEEIKNFDGKWRNRFNAYFSDNSKTFKFEVDVFNKKITLEERVAHIEELQKYIVIPGDVSLKDPDVTLTLALDFEEKTMQHFYFGKLVGYSQRHVIHRYNLKKRYFIGNTSMDPQLALLMANQAHATKGGLCFDPFVGTGSIIVACAHYGCLCGGGDIDYNVIYGRGKSSRAGNKNFRSRDEIIRTNFDHYNLYPFYWDIMACDATHLPFRVTEIFDAIVTDPPYGIREGGRKLGSKKDTVWEIAEDIRDEHIPAKRMHTLSSIIVDLLEFSFKYLITGGRLVYWLPVYKPSYTDEMVPQHPGFIILANSEQHLTKTVSRRLITMKKIKVYNDMDSVTYRREKQVWKDQQNQFRNNYFSVNSSGNG